MSFDFKQFSVSDARSAMKVGTDGVLLGAWTCVEPDCSHIVDVGTGSGLVALMLAQRAPKARILGFDISAGAVADAAANFAASPFSSRLTALEADAATYTPPRHPDLIVCNPPFFTGAMTPPDADRHAARHQGSLCAESLLEWGARHLAPHGTLAMITPADDISDIIFQAELRRLRLWRQCMVSTVDGRKPTRALWQFSRQDRQPEVTALSVRDARGNYTEAYACLTADFYLNV